MSVDDVKDLITRAIAAIDTTKSALSSIASDVRGAGVIAAAAVYDSQHSDVQAGLAAIEAAEKELELTHRRLESARDRCSDYLEAL